MEEGVSGGGGGAWVAHQLRVEVEDDGRGMTPEEQAGIFVPFSRLHTGEEGTGLGLNISRRAMVLHGGGLSVSSEGLGHGTTFTLTARVWLWRGAAGGMEVAPGVAGSVGGVLSSGTASAGRDVAGEGECESDGGTGVVLSGCASAPVGVGRGGAVGSSSMHLLVVDDDATTRRALARLLRRRLRPASVVAVRDGRAAVEYVLARLGGGGCSGGGARVAPEPGRLYEVDDSGSSRQLVPAGGRDVSESSEGSGGRVQCGGTLPTHITLDNAMPRMTGVEAARAMRGAGYGGRVVGLTGNAVQSDRDEFMRAGADVVLTKPVDGRGLSEALLGGGEEVGQWLQRQGTIA